MGKEKQIQTANESTQYRRAKTSTIILVMLQGASCACFYSAIGSVSYAANLGFGISVLLVGLQIRLFLWLLTNVIPDSEKSACSAYLAGPLWRFP